MGTDGETTSTSVGESCTAGTGEPGGRDCEGSARTSGLSKTDLAIIKNQNQHGSAHTLKDRVDIGMNSSSNGETTYARLDDPKVVLFDRKKVQMGWKAKMPIGCGFVNLGNSCYLNATLQTLFHTPAFINWLLSDEEHRSKCRNNNQSLHQCIICPMATTAYEAYYRNNHSQSIRPILIHNKLKLIGKNFTNGRQEDAHEFMRLLLESMEDSYLTAANGHKLDSRSKETTPLAQIFGGYYRDEVTCLKCQFVSTTFHPQAELQLDIRNVSSIEDGIALHFKREQLENNDYRCEKCGTMELATKQHFLETPPIVLCVQLKRFRQHGTKITKPIHINKTLSLKRFIHSSSREKNLDAAYHLVGLISHIGSSQNCGHYTAIAEAQNGMFYHFDDSCVRLTNLKSTQNSDAYVVIYEMSQSTAPAVLNNISSSILGPPPPVPKIFSLNSDSDKTFVIPRDNLNKTVSRNPGPGPFPTRFPLSPSPDKSEVPERPFSPYTPFPNSLNNMTVDEIIDKWCTPTKSTNVQPESSTSSTTTAEPDSTKNDDPPPPIPEPEAVVPTSNKRSSDQMQGTTDSDIEDGKVVKKPRLD